MGLEGDDEVIHVLALVGSQGTQSQRDQVAMIQRLFAHAGQSGFMSFSRGVRLFVEHEADRLAAEFESSAQSPEEDAPSQRCVR